MLDQLPKEVQLLVLEEHLMPRDLSQRKAALAPLTLVCKRLRDVAQDVLFSHLQVDIFGVEIARRVLADERRAALTSKAHAFDIMLSERTGALADDAASLVPRLLALFRNAREGHLLLAFEDLSLESPLEGLHFEHLVKLRLNYFLDGLSSAWLTAPMQASPNLEDLHINGRAWLWDMPAIPIQLPELTRLGFHLGQPQDIDEILWPTRLIDSSTFQHVTTAYIGRAEHAFMPDDTARPTFPNAITLGIYSPLCKKFDLAEENEDEAVYDEFDNECAFDLSRFSAYDRVQTLDLEFWCRPLVLAELLPILPLSVQRLTILGRSLAVFNNLRSDQVNPRSALKRVEVNWVPPDIDIEIDWEFAIDLFFQCQENNEEARRMLRRAGVSLKTRGTLGHEGLSAFMTMVAEEEAINEAEEYLRFYEDEDL